MRSYLFTFVLALLLAFLFTPMVARLGRRVGAVDTTKGEPIPRAGGVAILLATALALILLSQVWDPVRSLIRFSTTTLRPVYFGLLGIAALGVIDDIHRLKAWPKLAIEIAIAVALYFAGVRAGSVWLPFGIVELGPVLGLGFTVLWIVGITNAFNLLDGIDGAATGAAVFALGAMMVASITLGQPLVALFCAALAGATLGFLPFNFPPARIYLGDAGSLAIGFALATLSITGATKGPALVAIAIPMVALAVPLLDTSIAVIRRAARGAPLFKGDREHLHHRLLALGLSNRQAAAIVYLACGGFALASMLFLNPNVRGIAIVLTMVAIVVWLSVRYLRLHEFRELGRLVTRGAQQTRAISFNVQLRRAADDLERTTSWDDIVTILARLFDASEFDSVRLIVQNQGESARHEYRLEEGRLVARSQPIRDDEWGVHLPFDIGANGSRGELAVFRRYGRRYMVTDVNLIVETLTPALSAAAGRIPRSDSRTAEVRIAHVGKFYPPEYMGGLETVVVGLNDELIRRGIEVSAVVAAVNGPSRIDEWRGVNVHRVRNLGTVFSQPICPGFAQTVRNTPSDILHLHHPNPLGDMSVRRDRRPLVITHHSDIVRQAMLRPLYLPMLRRAFTQARAITIGSEQLLKTSRELKGFEQKARVIPFGIDGSVFAATPVIKARAASFRSAWGGRPVVLAVGRLVKYKGFDVLVEAMLALDATLVIVGTGPEENRLRALAIPDSEHPVPVIFPGRLSEDDLLACYHACDVFCLPSTTIAEAFGMVLLEAMACGKPLVTTSLPTGVSAVNRDGVTGLQVPPGNAPALRDALAELLKDAATRRAMGEAAKKVQAEEYSAALMGERFLELYRELL